MINYFNFLIFSLICFLILTVLFMLSLIYVESDKFNHYYDTSFECGFEPMFSSRVPFSNQFFQITIIFLIFDLEIVIFIPLTTDSTLNSMNFIWVSIMIFILLLGLIVEWYDNSLEWVI